MPKKGGTGCSIVEPIRTASEIRSRNLEIGLTKTVIGSKSF